MAPLARTLARNRGFTLTELLVVLTIIGVLAGIILGVLGNVQATSRRVKCLSNLRQLGAGVLSYAGDNQATPPCGVTWDTDIAPYLSITSFKQSAPSFICPSDTRANPMADGSFPRSYTVNGLNAQDAQVGLFSIAKGTPSRRLTVVSRVSTCVMIFEYFTGNAVANKQFQTPYSWSDGYLTASGAPRLPNGSYYHGAVENYVFADGHAEALNPAVVCNSSNVLWRAY